MSSLSELQRIDRELSSELAESPINPAFLHMSTPLNGEQCIDRELSSELAESPINAAFLHVSAPLKCEHDPLFYLQINGEALWQWRKLNSDPQKAFEVLQGNLAKVGYKLLPSSALRVGIAVTSRIGYVVRRLRNMSNGNHRQSFRSGYWCSVAIHPDEIAQGPAEVISELKRKEEQLIRENKKLSYELEGKCLER